MSTIPIGMKLSLKTARELKGLKQSDAAALIGVSTDTLGNYERGKAIRIFLLLAAPVGDRL